MFRIVETLPTVIRRRYRGRAKKSPLWPSDVAPNLRSVGLGGAQFGASFARRVCQKAKIRSPRAPRRVARDKNAAARTVAEKPVGKSALISR